MYQYYRLLTLTLNISGGASETIEKLTKEVKDSEGNIKVVPCNKAEAELKFHDKIKSVGGNPATQSIRCILFDPKGDFAKVDEIIKTVEPTEEVEE